MQRIINRMLFFICVFELLKSTTSTAPQNITDFECIGEDYWRMNCSFTIPENTNTNYTLNYFVFNEYFLHNCTNFQTKGNKGYCILGNDSYRPHYNVYNFTVTSKNAKNETNEQSILIYNKENMIPPTPKFFFENITSSSVTLVWHIINYRFYEQDGHPGIKCNLQIQPDGEPFYNHTEYIEHTPHKGEFKLEVRGLKYPYYNYTVQLKLHVTYNSKENLWSLPYTSRFQTNASLPDSPPSTDVGSFYVNSSEIRLYWKTLPFKKQNGPNFHYKITEIQINNKTLRDCKLARSDNISASFSFEKHSYYKFTIRSKNDAGYSISSSEIIYSPMQNDVDNIPTFIGRVVNAETNSTTLSWEAPRDTKDLIDYTVFWCRGKEGVLNECEDSINFEHVSISKKNISIIHLPKYTLNMGISANYKQFSSGLQWTKCTTVYKFKSGFKSTTILSSTSTSITIKWEPELCFSGISGYNLSYCRFANFVCKEWMSVKLNRTENKYTLYDLKPFSKYELSMSMFTKWNTIISAKWKTETLEDAPSPPHHLESYNVTQNYAWLKWEPPSTFNGVIRFYTINIHNGSQIVVNCSIPHNDCAKNLPEIRWKLENLYSFTKYKVNVTAHTSKTSPSSNEIDFITAIGIPSNPSAVRYEEKDQLNISWEPPKVPSGPIDFYEFSFMTCDINSFCKKQLSILWGNTTNCLIKMSSCHNVEYSYIFQVRAVNKYKYNISQHSTGDFNDLNTTEDIFQCENSLYRNQKPYNDIKRYNLYRSAWENSSPINCKHSRRHLELGRLAIHIILVVFIFISIIAVIRIGHVKIKNMSNINCVLPDAVTNLANKNDEKNDKDSESYQYEYLQLLRNSSKSNMDRASILATSAVIKSDYVTDKGSSIQSCVEPVDIQNSKTTAVATTKSDYLLMDEIHGRCIPIALDDQSSEEKSNKYKNSLLISTCESTYIKPNQISSWNNVNSVQQEANKTMNGLHDDKSNEHPHIEIDGYVTHKELSAFGQHNFS